KNRRTPKEPNRRRRKPVRARRPHPVGPPARGWAVTGRPLAYLGGRGWRLRGGRHAALPKPRLPSTSPRNRRSRERKKETRPPSPRSAGAWGRFGDTLAGGLQPRPHFPSPSAPRTNGYAQR